MPVGPQAVRRNCYVVRPISRSRPASGRLALNQMLQEPRLRRQQSRLARRHSYLRSTYTSLQPLSTCRRAGHCPHFPANSRGFRTCCVHICDRPGPVSARTYVVLEPHRPYRISRRMAARWTNSDNSDPHSQNSLQASQHPCYLHPRKISPRRGR